MRGQRLAGIFVKFWAVLCAKSATNNIKALITEIAEPPPPLSELGHEAGYGATFVLTVRGKNSARPDLLIPGGSCFTHAESHAPASRQGTSRGLLREFPAASVRASP